MMWDTSSETSHQAHTAQVPQSMRGKAFLTWKCIYINDRMLPGLIVNDDIDSKEGNSQSLPQRLRDFPDDVVIWPLIYSFDFIQL